MKVLVIGAAGEVGSVVSTALGERHEVIGVSRSTNPGLDILDPDSIDRLFAEIGRVDAVVDCAGAAAFKPFAELRASDFEEGVRSKALAKVELLIRALPWLNDGGSVTFTTGITAREPVPGGSVGAFANGALESFTRAVARELPRGVRVNSVSPTVLAGSPALQGSFLGFTPASLDEVAAAYLASVEGAENGNVYSV